jgi:hypothetical protein
MHEIFLDGWKDFVQTATESSASEQTKRVSPSLIPFPQMLQHLMPQLHHLTVVRSSSGAFCQTAFSNLLSSRKLRKHAVQDCMRLHASMWAAAAVSKSAHRNALELCCELDSGEEQSHPADTSCVSVLNLLDSVLKRKNACYVARRRCPAP